MERHEARASKEADAPGSCTERRTSWLCTRAGDKENNALVIDDYDK